MADNILSYFTKDIIDPIERRKYRVLKIYNFILIYYNDKKIWEYDLRYNLISNYKFSIYKRFQYTENKPKRFFTNNYISNNISQISINIRDDFDISYRITLQSYLIKTNFIYSKFYYFKTSLHKILLCKILYYNMYIYKYYNTKLFRTDLNYYKRSKPLIFISNKYELDFYSKLFLIFFVFLFIN